MTRREWAAVVLVIGGGILLQIPGHDDGAMDHAGMDHAGMDHAEMEHGADARLETVVFDVTGMT